MTSESVGVPTTPAAQRDGASYWLIAVVSTAALMAVIDGTIVTASLQAITDELHTSIGVGAWFTSAYLVAAGTTMPLSGWIISRLTPRRTLLISLVFFVGGSVLCAFATSAPELIIFRLIQGIGGGLLEPTALTIAAIAAGPAGMGRTMGIVSAVINVAPVVGPLVGSAIVGTGQWQWIFLINVPLGAVVIIGALLVVRRSAAPTQTQRPDLVGAVALPAGLVTLLLAIESASLAARTWIALAVGAALLSGYAVRALRITRPSVLDLRLLQITGFRAGLGVMAAVGFTMYFQLVGLALLAQRHFHVHSVGAGLLVSALGAGLLVSMTIGGIWSDRLGPRRIVVAAATLAAVVAIVIAASLNHLAIGGLAVLTLVFGLAFGAVAAPSFASVYRVVPADRITHATPSLFVTVQLCAAIGAAVAATLISALAAPTAMIIGYALIAALMATASVAARGLPGPA